MIYEFDDYRINTDEFKICQNGTNVPVEPKVYDVIVYLITHRDRVITRTELLNSIWPGVEVLDSTLSNHIKLARSALDDSGHEQRIIKTIHGRGYQFIGNIVHTPNLKHKAEKEISQKPHYKIRFKTSLYGLVIPITIAIASLLIDRHLDKSSDTFSNTKKQSIAVLPFKSISPDSKDQFFISGFHDELLTEVSKITGIKTVSRNSVLLYKQTEKSLEQIGEELKVENILKGTLQRDKEKIRVNVQLIQAQSGEILWAESFTENMNIKNVFSIQADISVNIANYLKLKWANPKTNNALPTDNIHALEAYFKAKSNADRNDFHGLKRAIEYLEQAVTIDPTFAIAHALIAKYQIALIYYGGLPEYEQATKAKTAIEKALKYNPNLSEAHAINARVQPHFNEDEASKRSYETAIRLNPNSADAYEYYGAMLLWYHHAPQEAVKKLLKASELNPLNDKIKLLLANAYTRAGEFNKAIAITNEIKKRKPGFPGLYRELAAIAEKDYHIPEIIRLLRESISIEPGVPLTSFLIGWYYMELMENEKALPWLTRSLELAPNSLDSPNLKAYILAINGDIESAFNHYLKVQPKTHLFAYCMYDAFNIAQIWAEKKNYWRT